MADYPALPLDVSESKLLPRDGRSEDVTGDGKTRVRKLYADRADFTLKHPALSATDLATIVAFYAANLTNTFMFYWPPDGGTYTVAFGAGAIRKEWASPTLTHVYIRLVAG